MSVMTATLSNASSPKPVRLRGLAAGRTYLHFARDPLWAVVQTHAAHGPLVIISDPIPFVRLSRVDAMAVGATFNREVLSNPDAWRTVRVAPGGGGPYGTSVRRLTGGIIRMRGRKHAHYRRLLAPLLTKASVEARGAQMTRLAAEEIASWPTGEAIDLAARVRLLVRNLGIGCLFSDDRIRGYPVADMVSNGLELTGSLRAACPINLPITPYGRMVRGSDALERRLLDWADDVRGRSDRDDLFSVIVNSPDENGDPLTPNAIVGHMPTLIAATYETCQNASIWTLILLAQHPSVARALCEELQDTLAGAAPTLEKVAALPLLDAVIKESMRLLPPVPLLLRAAERETSLGGQTLPKGAHLVLSPFLTNRDPGLYPEPDRFLPRRWTSLHPTPFEYPVFGAGPHGCAGPWFGLSAVKVTLASILARYRFTLLPQRIDYTVKVTMRPRGPVQALLHRQDGAFTATALRGGLTKLIPLAAN